MWSQSPRPTFPAPSLRPSSEGHQSVKSWLLAEQLLTGQKLVGAKGFDLAAKVVTCRQQFCTQRHSEPCSGPKSIRVASRWLKPCIQHDPYATHHIPSHNEWVSPHTAYLIRSARRNSVTRHVVVNAWWDTMVGFHQPPPPPPNTQPTPVIPPTLQCLRRGPRRAGI